MLNYFNPSDPHQTVDSKGEAYMTPTGYAKISGKSVSEIEARCNGATWISAKTVYRWLLADNPKLADEFGSAGATAFLHLREGYTISSTKPGNKC